MAVPGLQTPMHWESLSPHEKPQQGPGGQQDLFCHTPTPPAWDSGRDHFCSSPLRLTFIGYQGFKAVITRHIFTRFPMQPGRTMWSQALEGGHWAISRLFWTTHTSNQPLPAWKLHKASQDGFPPEWLVKGAGDAGRKQGAGDKFLRAFLGLSLGCSRPLHTRDKEGQQGPKGQQQRWA